MHLPSSTSCVFFSTHRHSEHPATVLITSSQREETTSLGHKLRHERGSIYELYCIGNAARRLDARHERNSFPSMDRSSYLRSARYSVTPTQPQLYFCTYYLVSGSGVPNGMKSGRDRGRGVDQLKRRRGLLSTPFQQFQQKKHCNNIMIGYGLYLRAAVHIQVLNSHRLQMQRHGMPTYCTRKGQRGHTHQQVTDAVESRQVRGERNGIPNTKQASTAAHPAVTEPWGAARSHTSDKSRSRPFARSCAGSVQHRSGPGILGQIMQVIRLPRGKMSQIIQTTGIDLPCLADLDHDLWRSSDRGVQGYTPATISPTTASTDEQSTLLLFVFMPKRSFLVRTGSLQMSRRKVPTYPGMLGCSRRIGWVRFVVVCFLYKTNPNPHEKLFACGEKKSGPNTTFSTYQVYYFSGWVGLGLGSLSVS